MAQPAAIRGEGLGKSYRHYRVIDDISFQLAPGACYALFGPNGSGKTTLLKILATLQSPSTGRFEIMGHDGERERTAARAASYLLAHGSHLYDDLNAAENIRFALGLRDLAPAAREITSALDRVGIGAFTELKCRYYSMGMKKRLAIAKALLARPKILLMDEAYASLDERGIDLVNHVILEMKHAGTAVFMTTHDRAKAADVADQVGVLRRGSLQPLTVRELLDSHELF